MKTLAASLSILTREGVMLYLLRGVAFTCIISVLGVIMGLIVGSLLALARTYCKKGPARILGWFAAAYIELFRNTPYLLWIFICVVFCPCPGFFARKMFGLTSVEMKLLFKAALALILFQKLVCHFIQFLFGVNMFLSHSLIPHILLFVLNARHMPANRSCRFFDF